MFDVINHWSWFTLTMILLIMEMLLPGIYFLWLGVAAALTGGIVLLASELSWQWQLAIYALLAMSAVLLSRKFLVNRQKQTDLPNLNRRAESYIGRETTLLEAQDAHHGLINLDDAQWRVEGNELQAQQRVRVVAVNGSVFTVEPV